MPTIEIACSACGELRWPTLPERPQAYVCVRCTAIPENVRQRRREAGQKLAETMAARKSVGSPDPQARKLVKHVQHYLAGSCNEAALEAFLAAIGHPSLAGVALDSKIERICAAFLREAK